MLIASHIKDKNNVEWRDFKDDDFLSDNKGRKFLKEKFKDYSIQKFTLKLKDGHYETLAKPNIIEDKLLTDEESKQVKLALWNSGLVDEVGKKIKEGRKLIFEQARPAKNDYKHDYARGTIHFTAQLRKDGTPLLRNYSYHKVIIPNGTMIKESNFTQRVPHTDAIQGENLTFIDCNLVNVERHPSWVIPGCNNAQIKRELLRVEDVLDDQGSIVVGQKKLVISHQIEQDPINKPNEFTEIIQKEDFVSEVELENLLRKYEEV